MNDWLFDLGNSRLKCAPLHADGHIGGIVAIEHDGKRFATGGLSRLPDRFDAASVASVAPMALRVALLDALAARATRISLAATQAHCGGVTIAYAQPQRFGVDRFLALLAARARGGDACLVVGVGTALTIDLLAADGGHRGGRIAPSPQLMRDALHARAAQLPMSGGHYVEFAADTDDALASGCEGAAIALIERSLAQAEAMLSLRPRLLLHGGGAPALLPQLGDAIHAPGLVLEGLAAWARDA
jgi:type III pantothenate kinase